ncbi:hypothetical protein HAX54_004199 [Datura stramonium]|uniref:Uncharacterized protein n=1 Tax=Datura stramonium TaxID=4076 RepID=A0ABS8T8X4_DATST|nr:hypothetical protein [Datura stramonium]
MVVKQAPAVWVETSSESEDDDYQEDASALALDYGPSSYESIFALIVKSNDKDDKDEKDVLIDELGESEVERNFMADRLIKLNEELREASRENFMLNDKLKKCMDSESIGKKVSSEIQLELESELKRIKLNLTAQLERNGELEKDKKVNDILL